MSNSAYPERWPPCSKMRRLPARSPFPCMTCSNNAYYKLPRSYEEANDATTLRHDPLFEAAPRSSAGYRSPLASPPTLSRFENHVSRTALYRMARVLVEQFLTSYARPPQRIVLDCDDTEDPVHGEQEQARYDGYDGGSCFLPLHLYAGLSERLMTTLFKAKRFPGTQRLSGLTRLVKRLRHAWPDTLLSFRGDSHFAYPEVRPWIEAPAQLSSVTGLTRKAVLQPLARDVVEQAKRAYERDGGKITRVHSTR